MSEALERFLAALRQHEHEPHKTGAGWECKCPAHDDHNPSLSIDTGDDGRVLMKCHAGCPVDAVCGSIGLRVADLFNADPARSKRGISKPRSRVTVTQSPKTHIRNGGSGDGDGVTYSTLDAALAELVRQRGTPTATWPYPNAEREIVGLTYRRDRLGGKKTVRHIWRTADGSKWVLEGGPKPHPLYRLPDLLESPVGSRVYVCEGEKTTDAVRAVGLLATTSAGGAERAKGSDWSPLAGREVVILPDHDKAGEKYADDVARLCVAAGALSVRIVRLVDLWAGMPKGGDLVDLLDNRGGDAERVRAEVESVTNNTTATTPKTVPIDGAPVMVCMANVKPRKVDWLWEGRIPRGRLTLVAGRPGEGKSWATMDWAARVSKGADWPLGGACPMGSVVLISGEDDPADTIRPRLDVHGADVNKIHLLQSVLRVDAKGESSKVMFTLKDVDTLEATLRQVPDCALVIVDPIGSFIGGDTDGDKDNKVRAVLQPLAMLAERTRAAIVMVAHQRKGTATHADDLVMGSRAFTGICRSVLHILADPDDNDRRLLLPGKMNLSRQPEGLAFAIDGDPSRVEWEPDPVAMTANDVLAAELGGRAESKAMTVCDWLTQRGGRATVNELTHGLRAFRGKPREARAALFDLCGEPEWVQNPRGGPTAEVFTLSRTVTGTPEAHAGKGGSSYGDTGDTTTRTRDGRGKL